MSKLSNATHAQNSQLAVAFGCLIKFLHKNLISFSFDLEKLKFYRITLYNISPSPSLTQTPDWLIDSPFSRAWLLGKVFYHLRIIVHQQYCTILMLLHNHFFSQLYSFFSGFLKNQKFNYCTVFKSKAFFCGGRRMKHEFFGEQELSFITLSLIR